LNSALTGSWRKSLDAISIRNVSRANRKLSARGCQVWEVPIEVVA
jgi:hypothetical protein